MKKFFVLIVLTIVCIFCFVGCVNTPDSPNTSTDLGNYEVGYEFEVYPTVEFNYKINEDFIVHISDISVTLIEKNEIKANDIIENKYYYPYTTKFEVTGNTDAKHSGKQIDIYATSGAANIHCVATINDDGSFYGSNECYSLRKSDIIYFINIII
ncbi:MAG: hypothetical protein K2K85_08195 [Clostridia bacterium]|nr:hypothetical protein [Clostridia bacterium]